MYVETNGTNPMRSKMRQPYDAKWIRFVGVFRLTRCTWLWSPGAFEATLFLGRGKRRRGRFPATGPVSSSTP